MQSSIRCDESTTCPHLRKSSLRSVPRSNGCLLYERHVTLLVLSLDVRQLCAVSHPQTFPPNLVG